MNQSSEQKKTGRPIRTLLRVATVAMLVLVATGGVWWSFSVWKRWSFLAECDAIDRVVLSWKDRCPPDVDQVYWDDACQTVQIAFTNVVYSAVVSLKETRRLRSEIEDRDKRPITVETFEWLLMRLAQTGPQGNKYITRMQPWWEESLDRVRPKEAN